MVVMADASQSTFTAPEDQELKNIIDKLANFVARNGSKFEEMTRQKQKDNPKFGFLNSGNTYYNYYRWRVSVEIAKNQTPQSHKQQGGTNSPYSSAQSIVQQAIVQQSINSAPWQQQQTAMPQIPAIHPPPPFAQPPATPAVYQQAPQPPRDLDLNEFDGMLQKLMDTGSKDAISTGRGWVFNNAKTSTHCQFIMEYILKRSLAPDLAFTKKLHLVYIVNDILHHVARKSAQDLQTAVEAVVVPMFCNAIQGESGDGLKKLNKVLGIWETNSFLDKSTMQKLKNPESSESIVTAAKEKFYPQPVSYDYQQAVSGQYPTNAYAYQQYYNQYTQYPPTSVPYEQPTTAAAAGQYEQQATSTPASATVQEEQQPQSSEADEEKPAESEKQTPQVDTEQKDFHSDNDNVQTNKDDQQQSSMDQGESEEQYPPHSYNHPPFPPQFNDPYYSGQQPPPHFSQDYRPPFPPFPLPNFNRPPPNFNEPPPNFHEPGFPVRPPFRQVFDYQHRDDYEPAPHEYEVHGDIDEYGPPDGYGPPVPPPPRPIIPDALYYELPAGLIAPMVKLSDIDYKPLDPRDIRLPAPQPPSDRLMAAVEAFYSPPNHERPRNSDGWEQGGLFEFFKAKLPFIKERDAREKEKPQPPVSNLSSPPQSPERRRRSHSRSPPRGRSHSTSPPYRQTSRSRSRSRSPVRRGRSRSKSPVRRGRSRSRSPVRRGRSRSRSRSPHRRRSYSRSRSRSRSPRHRRSRSPSPRRRHSPSPPRKRSLTPPSFNPFMTKTLDTRLDESNVGHQLLKKMGWEGAGLGKDEKGIQDPIKAGEVRARHNQYKGIGVETDDEFERFRYNRSYTYNRRRLKTIQEKAKQSAANSEEPATGSPR